MPRLRGRKEEVSYTDQSSLVPTAPHRAPSPPKPKVYAFECGVIKLNERDFNRWKAAFPNIELVGELTGMAGWAAKTDNWFYAVSSLLAKRNREQAVKLREAENRGRYTGNNGTTRVIF